MRKIISLFLIALISFATACQTLQDVGGAIGKPALVVITTALLANNPEWYPVIRTVTDILEIATRAGQSIEKVLPTIESTVLTQAPGPLEDHEKFLNAIRDSAQSPPVFGDIRAQDTARIRADLLKALNAQ